MNEIKRTALIGAGVIGCVHAQCMKEIDRPFDAICDIDVEKAESLASLTSPNALIYTDFKQLIDEIKPDVIHVCTPHYLHAEMIIYALERNINVLCEKPLCISNDEIGAVLEAEQRSAAKLGVCMQNRYLESNVFVKNYLADKEIIGAHGYVVWHRTEKYYNSAAWRGTLNQEGGGVMINQSIHTLDLLRWFCGDPESVIATTNNLSHKGVIEVEDTASAFFDGKHPFSLFATTAASNDMPVNINFRLSNGDNVTLLPDTVIINGDVHFSATKQQFMGKSCYGNGHQRLIPHFYQCIMDSKPFEINGVEAAQTLRLVLAAYQSNEKKISL